MSRRLATEYKNIVLSLNEAQWTSFLQQLRQHIRVTEKVIAEGEMKLSLESDQDHFIFHASFDGDCYHLSGNGILQSRDLSELLRKLMAESKGEALVHRIFQSFIIEYNYEFGTVASIRELQGENQDVIFENRDLSFTLQKIFHNQQVEQEITQLKDHVNDLLDERNLVDSKERIQEIDQRLLVHAKRLQQLEA